MGVGESFQDDLWNDQRFNTEGTEELRRKV
jgi:hypothetical protein